MADIENLNTEKLNSLAQKYTSEFSETETSRQPKEQEWLESLRQYVGIHDPDVAFEENESKLYSGYTRSKVVPLIAKLIQTLIFVKEKNWGVEPTPKPSVPDDILQRIIQSQQNPQQEDIEKIVYKWTDERCLRMAKVLLDQQIEDDYQGKQIKQLESGVIYGTGIIAGAISKPYKETEYVMEDNVISSMYSFISRKSQKKWTSREVIKYTPETKHIPIWYFFPDLSTTEFSLCNFVYTLHSMTKHQLRNLTKRDDFIKDNIQSILKSKPQGNYSLRNWEVLLQSIDNKNINQQSQNPKTYEVIERNGYIDKDDLIEAGIELEDEADEYFCNIWLCDKKVIKIIVHPIYKSLQELFHIFYYEKDETSIFGRGLPRIIRHRQLALNRAEQHMLNHAAWFTEPCGELNIALLDPKQTGGVVKFAPRAFIKKWAMGAEANQQILRLYDVADRTASIINIAEYQKVQGDLESSLPSYLFGSPSTGGEETARGISVRFANLVDFLKRLAKNFDSASISYIKSQYKWNMMVNPDESIKGDMDIKVVGSGQALVKSTVVENIGFLLQNMPPDIQEYYKKYEFAKEIFSLFFDNPEKFLFTEEEKSQMDLPLQQAKQQIEDLQKQLMMAKAQKDMAQSQKTFATAKKIVGSLPFEISQKQIENEKIKEDIYQQQINNAKGEIETAKEATDEG